ncbi:hypothetical protein GCM10022211_14730 [Sphingomonas humi]|uniref:DNA (cytosine-5-)-methyltransferase n=1 Tax=Sphingomonas humi TaxID=335630 RepID=A0ABP7RY29_9SPHN
METLEGYGYVAAYSLINAAFHGVPQMRDRVYLIAYRRELGQEVTFPAATRHITLPPGYSGTRAVALRYTNAEAGYREPDLGTEELPFAVTAQEAIGDLPPIQGESVRRGARKFDKLAPYRAPSDADAYANLMRNWPGFTSSEGVYDHVIRSLPRDGPTFREMPHGAEYPEAFATAERIFNRTATELNISPGTVAYAELRKTIVPPYDVAKFPNKWWKLRPDFPVRTLMAHIGKDTYSHIHYDGAQQRTISVREAARLQSFPDGFRFEGAMNAAFRQIGNAVPPLMAFALAEKIGEALGARASQSANADASERKTEREAA